MSEQVLSTEEVKKKLLEPDIELADLGFYPQARAFFAAPEFVRKFGKFLAGRLADELVPFGFVMACELAIQDLEKGVDGHSGKPIRNSLVGYPPQVYAILAMNIPVIANAVCPTEFAAEVSKIVDQAAAAR